MYDSGSNNPAVAATDSPSRLKEVCMDYICDHLPEIAFPTYEIFFHTELAESLLRKFCQRRRMTDSVLTLLFDPAVTRLRNVALSDSSRLTKNGLKTLRGHKIRELDAVGLNNATVTDLIGCLGEWTLSNLLSLNVSGSTFVEQNNKYTVVIALAKLTNLRTLNVSGTEFNKTSLELVVDLKFLENLDISSTKVSDISPLRKCKRRLKSLSMYALKFHAYLCESVVDVLMELNQLVHLDISEDRDDHPFDILSVNSGRLHIARMLMNPSIMPDLASLDISGKDEVTPEQLHTFVCSHPHLKFLGLVLTDICNDEIFFDKYHPLYGFCQKDLVISGNANEEQVLEALRRYGTRPQYVQKSLYHLFRMTQGYLTPRVDIIKLVLEISRKYQKVFSIQMAATACLFNLCKNELSQRLHPQILSAIVQADLDAMEEFPQHRQLQKNVLLTICSDRILTEVNFDKYRCAKLVMDCLCAWPDTSMNRMSVAICSILAAKISTTQTSELGSHSNYMRKLLSIVRNRMNDGNIDITMKFTLSALWNLTDESPKTSSVFLAEGGMALFVQVLETFPGDQSIETKILGLLNNIAEVHHLRICLMDDSFITILRKLLHSTNIDVSYFAAGIVAHLASDGPHYWYNSSISMNEMTSDLWYVVTNWKTPKEEMVAYRSFKPFLPLMALGQKDAVQLWAVWAIHHVCTKNAQRYCAMLKQQGGDVVIANLMKNSDTKQLIVKLCEQIIDTMDKHGFYPSYYTELPSTPAAIEDGMEVS